MNLHVDGVEVLVGPPDVDVLNDGTDADALTAVKPTLQEIASEPPDPHHTHVADAP